MSGGQTTCWTVIREAAGGDAGARQRFAERYERIVRSYLLARWRGSPLAQEVDDVIQEVFIEAFRDGGVLERADPKSPVGFRAFFYGVIRNVARRAESKHGRRRDRQPPTAFFGEAAEASEQRLSGVFDREWARAMMREAADRQREAAEAGGPDAQRRVELLRMRFYEGWPIREIARLWNADPAALHREYARARKEFKLALAGVVAFHHPGSAEAIERECAQMLALLE
jgi:RNA polymerase sigma-70 factor (ECF subfamily)